MLGKVVYKTDDKYIKLFEDNLEEIDYYCHYELENEEEFKNLFSFAIGDLDGELKILINPQDINLKEVSYHKDIRDFNHLKEINVRYDCSDKKEFINRIAKMMLDSEEVLDGLFDRFSEDLDEEKKKRYLLGKFTDNYRARLSIVGCFLEERFKDKDSYLFARELEEYCKNIYEKEMEIVNKK